MNSDSLRNVTGDGDLGRAAAIAADDRVRRVVPVHGEADETDRGKAPVALRILGQPELAGLSAIAAAEREDLMRVGGHGAWIPNRPKVRTPPRRWFDPDQTAAMTMFRLSR